MRSRTALARAFKQRRTPCARQPIRRADMATGPASGQGAAPPKLVVPLCLWAGLGAQQHQQPVHRPSPLAPEVSRSSLPPIPIETSAGLFVQNRNRAGRLDDYARAAASTTSALMCKTRLYSSAPQPAKDMVGSRAAQAGAALPRHHPSGACSSQYATGYRAAAPRRGRSMTAFALKPCPAWAWIGQLHHRQPPLKPERSRGVDWAWGAWAA